MPSKRVDQKLECLKIKAESEALTGIKEMTDWERDFCQDVWKNTWVPRQSLSEKVEKIVHDLYDKYFNA